MQFPLRPDDRRVRHLRLAAPSEALARHAVVLLEDALRTASIAGESGSRMLYFRRISAGHIRPGQSATSLSLFLEGQFRAAAALAVHGSTPAAESAPAVWFANPVEPCVAAAERVAKGLPLTAWFWRLAVPEAARAEPPARTLLALCTRLAATEAGTAAVAAFLDALVRHEAMAPFLADLAPADGARLADLLGLPRAPVVTFHQDMQVPTARRTPVADRTWQELLRTWVARWRAADPRSRWLAAAAFAAATQVRLSGTAMLEGAELILQATAAGLTPVESESVRASRSRVAPPVPSVPVHADAIKTLPREGAAVSSVSPSEGRRTPVEPAGEPSTAPPARTVPPERVGFLAEPVAEAAAAETTAPPISAPVAVTPAQPAPPPAAIAQPSVRAPVAPATAFTQPPYQAATTFAGLYFLLPVLARLELPKASEDQLAARLADRILLDVARRLRIPPDDPILAPLEAPEHDTAGWIRAIRIWCVRRARIPLRSVVRRVGLIAFSRTHIDVTLPLTAADIRIRRAGLDLDPGWAPWFGRVVHFHYEHGVGT